jgi:hypothetical protein
VDKRVKPVGAYWCCMKSELRLKFTSAGCTSYVVKTIHRRGPLTFYPFQTRLILRFPWIILWSFSTPFKKPLESNAEKLFTREVNAVG